MDHFRCWAEIDCEALRHNARVCREVAGPACGIMAIVKADAYGHGMSRVAQAIEGEVDGFGVANAAEAIELAGNLSPEKAGGILMLGPALDFERSQLIERNIAASVSTVEEAEAFNAVAAESGTKARIHAVADTGMGRMGARSEDFPELVERIQSLRHLKLEGVASHLPSADEEAEFTREQIQKFEALVSSLALTESVEIHLANSAGVFGFSGELAGFTTVARPGLAIYGISPLPEFQQQLRPALSLKTRVTLVRDLPAGATISYGRIFTTSRPTRVATLGIGYGDGYPRHLSGQNAEVLINGIRCPMLGRVTMDQIVADVTDSAGPVEPGAEAILIGSKGEETITAVELAEKAGTIAWEIFTGITGRVKRKYL